VTLTLLIPGSIDQLTGGYLFARHVVEGLGKRGQPIDVVELAGRFPDADAIARESAAHILAQLPDEATAIIDGLALDGFSDCLADEAKRLRLVGWVHHPLADETGLSAAARARFHALETKLLPLFRGVICPSRCTRDAVARYGVSPARIAVAPPGTAKPTTQRAHPERLGPLTLLSVATVTPRKGHLVLIEALAKLRRDDWQLRCIGSTTRDPAHVAAVRRAIAEHGLERRVSLQDEMPQESLGAAYDAADLFVLPSFHEGYGMAFAEALAHGLPIIATRAGAIPDTVPETASILVPPGDAAALGNALARVLDDRALLARLAQGAAAAGALLPDWPQAIAQWQSGVKRLLG
jgi:glycosyltransferase involved in cell wall biosynthesis